MTTEEIHEKILELLRRGADIDPDGDEMYEDLLRLLQVNGFEIMPIAPGWKDEMKKKFSEDQRVLVSELIGEGDLNYAFQRVYERLGELTEQIAICRQTLNVQVKLPPINVNVDPISGDVKVKDEG